MLLHLQPGLHLLQNRLPQISSEYLSTAIHLFLYSSCRQVPVLILIPVRQLQDEQIQVQAGSDRPQLFFTVPGTGVILYLPFSVSHLTSSTSTPFTASSLPVNLTVERLQILSHPSSWDVDVFRVLAKYGHGLSGAPFERWFW